MKKLLSVIVIVLAVLLISIGTVFANNIEITTKKQVKVNEIEKGQIFKIKEDTKKEVDDYIERYGSEAYGYTAYVLKKVQIYSIPFCFLGVALSAIYQFILGIRKLDTRDKGFYSLVGFVTLFVICQVLPLVFAIVVKGWRG